jgi:predicted GIY-YIG superfamily endonuclease
MQALDDANILTKKQRLKYGEEITNIIKKYVRLYSTYTKVVVVHDKSSVRKNKKRRAHLQKTTDDTGKSKPTKKPKVIIKGEMIDPTQAQHGVGVYILELENGKIYVGKSKCIDKRIEQHKCGNDKASAFTKKYKPTGKRLPRLSDVTDSTGEAVERAETLLYMYHYGIDNVRGWRYTREKLSDEERKAAEIDIREIKDLCRHCGRDSHMVKECTHTTDRFGKAIKKLH